MSIASALAAGTELVGDYRIVRVLGAGGFGITYLAEEVALGRSVTIKEYFPSDFAARNADCQAAPRSQQCAGDYKWGLERFIEEAQTLARFDHPNIVKVFRYFRANNTGYMVLSFEEGQSLKAWMRSLGRAPRQKEVDRLLAPLLEALAYVHAADYLHRDLAPDNIMIRPDGAPVLIDFGSARGEIAQHTRTLSALVKPGYSPYEQYAETGHRQGPWTDIYALGATLYHIVCSKRPPDAPSRVVNDELLPARDVAIGAYRAGFLAAIDRALLLETTRRPQSVAAWKGDLLAPDPRQPGWLRRTFGASRKSNAVAPPSGTAAPTGAVPPPPDAPGQKGGLLDYIDGLKQKAEPPASLGTLAVGPGGTVAIPREKVPSQSRKPEPSPAPAKDAKPSKPSKPAKQKPEKAVPAPRGRRWRPFAYKLLAASAIAGAFISLQGNLPRMEVIGSSIMSSAGKQGPASIPDLRGHRGSVTAVGFTEDGRSIVTAGADATVKVWSVANSALVRSIDTESGPATALALSGRRAVTGHAEGTVALWDIDRGAKVAAFKRNGAQVWSVAFTGDPSRVAAASHDWSVTVWDAASGSAPVHIYEGHDNVVHAIGFSERGPYIASASADKTVKLWSADSQSLIRTYRGHKDFVTAIAISASGKAMASAGLDGNIRVWSTASSRLIRSFPGHRSRIGGVAFTASGNLLASAGDDGEVKLWDLKRWRAVRTIELGTAAKAVAFSPDGLRLAAAGDDGRVRLFEVTPPARSKDE